MLKLKSSLLYVSCVYVLSKTVVLSHYSVAFTPSHSVWKYWSQISHFRDWSSSLIILSHFPHGHGGSSSSESADFLPWLSFEPLSFSVHTFHCAVYIGNRSGRWMDTLQGVCSEGQVIKDFHPGPYTSITLPFRIVFNCGYATVLVKSFAHLMLWIFCDPYERGVLTKVYLSPPGRLEKNSYLNVRNFWLRL